MGNEKTAATAWIMLMKMGSEVASKAINVKQIAKLTNYPILDDEKKVDSAKVNALRAVILSMLLNSMDNDTSD